MRMSAVSAGLLSSSQIRGIVLGVVVAGESEVFVEGSAEVCRWFGWLMVVA